jgi:hypothetical protein
MTDIIYSLNIVTGIDDYKQRGESAYGCVSLHKTYGLAFKCLKMYLTQYLVNLSTEYDFSYTIDEFDEFDYDYLLEQKSEDGTIIYVYFDGMEIKDCDVEGVYYMCCKGEFIPYRWTYSIEEHKNPHNQ